jgi:hypothetical protein
MIQGTGVLFSQTKDDSLTHEMRQHRQQEEPLMSEQEKEGL